MSVLKTEKKVEDNTIGLSFDIPETINAFKRDIDDAQFYATCKLPYVFWKPSSLTELQPDVDCYARIPGEDKVVVNTSLGFTPESFKVLWCWAESNDRPVDCLCIGNNLNGVRIITELNPQNYYLNVLSIGYNNIDGRDYDFNQDAGRVIDTLKVALTRISDNKAFNNIFPVLVFKHNGENYFFRPPGILNTAGDAYGNDFTYDTAWRPIYNIDKDLSTVLTSVLRVDKSRLVYPWRTTGTIIDAADPRYGLTSSTGGSEANFRCTGLGMANLLSSFGFPVRFGKNHYYMPLVKDGVVYGYSADFTEDSEYKDWTTIHSHVTDNTYPGGDTPGGSDTPGEDDINHDFDYTTEYFTYIKNFKYENGYMADAKGTEEKDYLDPTPFTNALGQCYVGLLNAARTDPIKMNVEHMDYTYQGPIKDAIFKVIHVNLLMPQYARRVEVEDLDKNFWVISLCLDACLNAIWSRGGIIDILSNIRMPDIFGETKDVSLVYKGDNQLNIYNYFNPTDLVLTINSQYGDRNINLPFINDVPDSWGMGYTTEGFNKSQFAHSFNRQVAVKDRKQLPFSLMFAADYKDATYSAAMNLWSTKLVYNGRTPITTGTSIMKQWVDSFNAEGLGNAEVQYRKDDGSIETRTMGPILILNYKFDKRAQMLFYDSEVYKIVQKQCTGTDMYRYTLQYIEEDTARKLEYKDINDVLDRINKAALALEPIYFCPLEKLHNGEIVLLSSDIVTNIGKDELNRKTCSSLELHHAFSHDASYNRILRPLLERNSSAATANSVSSHQSLYMQYVKPILNTSIIPTKDKVYNMIYFQKEIIFDTTMYTLNNSEYTALQNDFIEYDSCNYNSETKDITVTRNVFSEAIAADNFFFHGMGSYLRNDAIMHPPSSIMRKDQLCVTNIDGKYNFTNGISVDRELITKADGHTLQDAVNKVINNNASLKKNLNKFCGTMSCFYRNAAVFCIVANDANRFVRFPKIDYLWFKDEAGQHRRPEQLMIIPISYQVELNDDLSDKNHYYQLEVDKAYFTKDLHYSGYDCVFKMPDHDVGNNVLGYALCFASDNFQTAAYCFKAYGKVGSAIDFIDDFWTK